MNWMEEYAKEGALPANEKGGWGKNARNVAVAK